MITDGCILGTFLMLCGALGIKTNKVEEPNSDLRRGLLCENLRFGTMLHKSNQLFNTNN